MRTARIGCVFVVAVGALALASYGQTYVEQGRLLEANNRVGSGGLNSGARTYPVGSANRFITGNVTGGSSFRGFSPVGDASSLFQIPRFPVSSSGTVTGVPGLSGLPSGGYYGLPSDQLSSFARDSFGVADLDRRRALVNRPASYYSPTNTVTNTGAIAAGLNRPGTSQPRSSYALPRADLLLTPMDIVPSDASSLSGKLLNVQPRLMRIDSGQPVTGPVNTRLLRSPLFGGVRAMPVDVLAAQAQREGAGGMASPVDLRVQREGPIDTRATSALLPPGVGPAGARPLDRVLGATREEAARAAAEGGVGVVGPTGPGGPETRLVKSLAEAPDVYGTMQSAAQLIRPIAGPGAGRGPEALPGRAAPEARGPEERLALARRLANEPLRTFAGTTASALNKRLAEAETLMKEGQYYRAAGVYDFARALDPRNPLPLLGRTLALLAAGDYMTSANDLFLAVQSSESIGHFQIELPAFIPEVNVLDRRRADLENQLEKFDDFRLRFLLGYVEYCSGLTDRGLSDLKKAAEGAPEELSGVKPFVDILERRTRGPIPPPALAPGT